MATDSFLHKFTIQIMHDFSSLYLRTTATSFHSWAFTPTELAFSTEKAKTGIGLIYFSITMSSFNPAVGNKYVSRHGSAVLTFGTP